MGFIKKILNENLDRNDKRILSEYLDSFSKETDLVLSFDEASCLFLTDKTRLICFIAGNLYHGNWKTAIKYINIYHLIHGDLSYLHVAFFSVSRGSATNSTFDSWVYRWFQEYDPQDYRHEYHSKFPEWIWDRNV